MKLSVLPTKTPLKRFVKNAARRIALGLIRPRDDLPLGLWNVTDREGDLCLHGQSLTKIAESYGTPLQVLDVERIKQNVRACMDVGPRTVGRVDLFFSYKTTPVPGLLKIIHNEGPGAEVISGYELWMARRLGVAPERIIVNGPAKDEGTLKAALSEGVLCINANHPEELFRIRDIARQLGVRAPIGLRIVFPGGWSGQFGMATNNGQAMEACRIALSIPELDLRGFHCHRGRLFESLSSWRSHVEGVLSFCEDAHRGLGYIPKLLDFGGSLPIPTTRSLSPMESRLARTLAIEPAPPEIMLQPSLCDYVRIAGNRVWEYFTQRSWDKPQIVIEPGRAITGNAMLLLASVITTRKMTDPFTIAVLDAGINIASIVQTEFHQLFPTCLKDAGGEKVLYRLVGPICHMGDQLYPAWSLPRLKDGDVLALMDSGAYFISDACSFSFPQPGIIAIDGSGAVSTLRRAETYRDLVALDCV